MDKRIVLTATDKSILTDVLEYLLDDRERQDFIDNHENAEDWFDEDDNLILEIVPREAKTHIYYKTSYLWNELSGADNA